MNDAAIVKRDSKTSDGKKSPLAHGDKFTPKRVEIVLRVMATGKSPTAAAKAAGVARSTLFDWREKHPEFKQLWIEAVEAGTDAIEDEMLRRAKDGVLQPVFYKGEQVAEVREFSDTLMVHTVNGRRPEKWRGKQTTDNNVNVNVSVTDGRARIAGLLRGIHERAKQAGLVVQPDGAGDRRPPLELEVLGPSKADSAAG